MRTECPLSAGGSNRTEWTRGAAGAGDANQTSKPGTRPNTSQLRVNSSIGQCGKPQYQEEQRNEREKGRRRVKECLPKNSRSLDRRNEGESAPETLGSRTAGPLGRLSAELLSRTLVKNRFSAVLDEAHSLVESLLPEPIPSIWSSAVQ